MIAYRISRLLLCFFLKVSVKFRIAGRENLPKRGPFIIASNHESYLDPPIVGAACNTVPVSFMAKKELFLSRMGWWFKAVDCIHVDREGGDAAALREALRRLKKGRVVGIFLEGTRQPHGVFGKAEPGIGFLAAKSGVPVVPMYIKDSGLAFGIGDRRVKKLPVSVKIGRPFVPGFEEKQGPSGRKETYAEVSVKIMERIKALAK